MKINFAICVMMLGVFCSFKTIGETNTTTTAAYPTTFVIGEHSTIFEKLSDEYSTLLLTACEDDMNIAFQEWKNVLSNIEQHAELNKFNLDGVKMWIKVFWSKEGQIEHIAFDLKPQSKKVNKNELVKLLDSFVKEYSTEEARIIGNSQFSHYGSVNYPIHKTSVLAD
ncbi:MAG: hypothetical protein ACPG19_15690 [Saprospiraceae bacterium]